MNIELPPALIDAVAEAVYERLRDRLQPPEPSPYLDTEQAAAYLCCTRQRIHDLLSSGRLQRIHEGRRVLIARADLEAHLAKENRR